jgi:3-oxoacyl-[acyl-carrier protein] reductase
VALAAEGADLFLIARTASQIRSAASEIEATSRRAVAWTADITDRAQVERAAAGLRSELGRLDVLVNNAGGAIERRAVLESDPDLWIADVHHNLISAYLVTRFMLPLMVESGGGRVINVGSGLGHQPARGAYCVGKAGMWMFTRSLAEEVWQHGIEVNELVPGPVETDATREWMRAGGPPPFAPSERVKLPDEVAPLAVWLATQPNGGPTGQSFSLARRPL